MSVGDLKDNANTAADFTNTIDLNHMTDKKSIFLVVKEIVRKELEHLILLNSQSLDLQNIIKNQNERSQNPLTLLTEEQE